MTVHKMTIFVLLYIPYPSYTTIYDISIPSKQVVIIIMIAPIHWPLPFCTWQPWRESQARFQLCLIWLFPRDPAGQVTWLHLGRPKTAVLHWGKPGFHPHKWRGKKVSRYRYNIMSSEEKPENCLTWAGEMSEIPAIRKTQGTNDPTTSVDPGKCKFSRRKIVFQDPFAWARLCQMNDIRKKREKIPKKGINWMNWINVTWIRKFEAKKNLASQQPTAYF